MQLCGGQASLSLCVDCWCFMVQHLRHTHRKQTRRTSNACWSCSKCAASKLLTAKSSSVRFSACRIDWCILFKSSSYKTNNNCLFMDFHLNSDSLWGVPWDLHKIKKPSYYYFFVPVWKLIFLMCDACITNHTVTCSALEYWVEMNIFINKMEVEQMRALKYHIFCAEEQPSHNHAKFTLKNWEWLESQLIWVWHHLVVLLGIAPEKTARPENWGSVFCRLVQTSCSWICYLTMPTKARKLTQRYANDQLQ